MSLRINHNIGSLNAHRNIQKNDFALSKNLERLSSGLRINRAADDAAGLIISEQMRAQITGLDQAIDNAETAVNMVQTAEGALDEMNSLLNKARELALHAANDGANDENQLAADQAELDEIINSITRIANNTQFGTKKLLDGTLGMQSNIADTNDISAVTARGLNADTYSTSLSTNGSEGSTAARATNNGALATSYDASDVTSLNVGTVLAPDTYDMSIVNAGTAGARTTATANGTTTLTDGANVGVNDNINDAAGTTLTGLQEGTYTMANALAADAGSTTGSIAGSAVATDFDTMTGLTIATEDGTTAIGTAHTAGDILEFTISDGVTSYQATFTSDGTDWNGSNDAAGITILSTDSLDAAMTKINADLDTTNLDGGVDAFNITYDDNGVFTLNAEDGGTYSDSYFLRVGTKDGAAAANAVDTAEMDGTASGGTAMGSLSNTQGTDATFDLVDTSNTVVKSFTSDIDRDTGSDTAFTENGVGTDTVALDAAIADADADTISLAFDDLRDVINASDSTNINGSMVFTENATVRLNDGTTDHDISVTAGSTLADALTQLNTELATQDVGATVSLTGGAGSTFSVTATDTGTYSDSFTFSILDTGANTRFNSGQIDDGSGAVNNGAFTGLANSANTVITLTGQGDPTGNVEANINATNNRGNTSFQTGGGANDLQLTLANAATAGVTGLFDVNTADLRDVVSSLTNANTASGTDVLTSDVVLSVGGTSVQTTANGTNTLGDAINALNTQLGVDDVGASVALSNGTFTLTADDRGTYSDDLQLTVSNGNGDTLFSTTEVDGDGTATSADGSTVTNTQGADAVVTLTASDNSANTTTISSNRYDESTANAATFSNTAGDVSVTFVDGTALAHTDAFTTDAQEFQIGANRDQTIQVSIESMRASDIGSVSDTVTTNDALNSLADLAGSALIDGHAQDAISIIDAAIDDVTTTRGDLGAIQSNALETTVSSLRVTRENLTAAESTIRDVDFAAESAEFARNNILIQSSTAMMAQANQMPNVMLQLIG